MSATDGSLPGIPHQPIRTVLAVATEWWPAHGGLSAFNRRLCVALAAVGLRVYCVVLTATPAERADAAASGVFLCEALTTTLSPELALARRPRLPEGVRPDLVIGHGRVTGPAAQSLAQDHFPDAMLIHFIHTAPDELEWWKDRHDDAGERAEARTRLEVDLARAAHRVCAVGPLLHLRYLNELHPYGVVPGRFDPGFDATRATPATAPPGAPIRVLVSGRAEDAAIKGLDLAARAMGIVAHRQDPDAAPVELVVRGAPAGAAQGLRLKLRAWARNPSLRIVVRPYTTDHEQVLADYRKASLVLMPSRCEGFGLVGAEAVVAGTPVLVSNRSGLALLLREVLPARDAARFVTTVSGHDRTDAERWARAVEAVLHDRPAAFRRSDQLGAVLAGRCTWSGAVGQLLTSLGIDCTDSLYSIGDMGTLSA